MRHLFFLTFTACQPGAAQPTSSNALAVVSICVEGGTATAQWPAPRHRGELFALVDDAGYVATARIGTRELDCDDCAGQSTDAVIVDRNAARFGCFTSVGPVTGPLPRARRIATYPDYTTSAHAESPWTPVEALDLDGDRRADVTVVSRCSRVVASGCSDHVCAEVCRGVRRGNNPAPHDVSCQSFVPDVDDCAPP